MEVKQLIEVGSNNTPSATSDVLLQPKIASNYTLAIWGTFDGATVTPKFSPDGGTTWVPFHTDETLATEVTLTSAAAFSVFGGLPITLETTNTGSAAIKATLI